MYAEGSIHRLASDGFAEHGMHLILLADGALCWLRALWPDRVEQLLPGVTDGDKPLRDIHCSEIRASSGQTMPEKQFPERNAHDRPAANLTTIRSDAKIRIENVFH